MKICITWMSMDISRRKEKERERKATKARMMKANGENQEMEKENPMLNLRPHSLLLCRIAESTTTSSLLFSRIKIRAWFSCIC